MDLFECAGPATPDLTKPIGSYSYICTTTTTTLGQNGNLFCTDLWQINGCSIQRVGDYDEENAYVSLPGGIWTVRGNKRCPKETNFNTVQGVPGDPTTDVSVEGREEKGGDEWGGCACFFFVLANALTSHTHPHPRRMPCTHTCKTGFVRPDNHLYFQEARGEDPSGPLRACDIDTRVLGRRGKEGRGR